MARYSHRGTMLAVGGVLTLGIGVYLPWMRTNPSLPSDAEIPTINITGMGAGIEGFDFALLGLAGLILALWGFNLKERVQPIFTFLSGVGIMIFCIRYLFSSSLFGFGATFVPAVGWYLTILGGFC